MLFKLKQDEIEQIRGAIKSNKDTVKSGYTDQMKELIDRGLRSQVR